MQCIRLVAGLYNQWVPSHFRWRDDQIQDCTHWPHIHRWINHLAIGESGKAESVPLLTEESVDLVVQASRNRNIVTSMLISV